MVKVKFLQGCRFEGVDYDMDKEYELEEDQAAALGDTVEVVGRKLKSADKPPKDKMVKAAAVQK